MKENKVSRILAPVRSRLMPVLVTGSLVASSVLAGAQESDTTHGVAAIVTSADTLLTSIYPIVVGAVAFGILIRLAKMIHK